MLLILQLWIYPLQEVIERFNEITEIFFEEIVGKGTLKEILGDLGWTIIQKKWMPPVIISQEYQKIKLPA
ncbi:MAG: hypothetical protein KAT28_04315 [Candidatus Aenigmarchaeota archaeon]|nr:hypothetical protein [Candidatus Aenigmarchaeota archaeon]